MIDQVNTLPANDKEGRAELINAYVNTLVKTNPDKDNVMAVLFHKGNWLQSPKTTLDKSSPNGVCGDVAVLKYETALRTGFTDNELRLVGGNRGLEFHTALMVNTGNKNFVLDNAITNRFHGQDSTNPNQMPIPDDIYRAGYSVKQNAYQTIDMGKFVPAYSFNQHGMHVYGSTGGNLLSTLGPSKKTIVPEPPDSVIGRGGATGQAINALIKQAATIAPQQAQSQTTLKLRTPATRH